MKFTFGPVSSRRLGSSLGVDILPFKTCNYDCIYCQLGPTGEKTVRRREYLPIREVLDEVRERLKRINPDYIALSGSGEPTLNSGIGELICELKKISPIPVAVLTNGSLLSFPEVRKALMKADVVLPSLDAPTDEIFQRINRPHRSITFSKMVDGMVLFRKEFKGKIWLEIMLVKGVNTSIEQVRKFIPLIELISPDRIQLNTVVRPAFVPAAARVRLEKMKKIANILGERAEIISEGAKLHRVSAPDTDIFSILRRRPCRLDELIQLSGLSSKEVMRKLKALTKQELIEKSGQKSGTGYFFKK